MKKYGVPKMKTQKELEDEYFSFGLVPPNNAKAHHYFNAFVAEMVGVIKNPKDIEKFVNELDKLKKGIYKLLN